MNIIFIGTSDFATPILKSLIQNKINIIQVITQPDKPIGRKQKLQASPIKLVALEYNIPIFQPENIKDQKSIEIIKKAQPDLIVVAAYGQILSKEILEIPKFGCLNIHASLLPKYRGASPIQSVILNGDKETGVTLMLMDEKMDTGKIIQSVKIEIQDNNDSQILHNKLANLGAELLIKILPKYIQETEKILTLWKEKYQADFTIGQIDSTDSLFVINHSLMTQQNESVATYTKILKREDGEINWTKSVQEIEQQIRAFSPWPGNFTKFKGKNCKIFKTHITNIKNDAICIGDFFLTKDNQLAVKCGNGILIIDELQIEGKKRMLAQEFLRGHKIF
ncbi:MAG: methionyl-tRNA formyltransferase [Patescibacteria group bacterium]